MTRDIGNRIGSSISNLFVDGGIFNTLQHYWFTKSNRGLSYTFSSSGEDLFIPASSDGYNYAIFTGSGSFALTGTGGNVEYMIVAGGGAGGSNSYNFEGSGGGGAGGFRTGIVYCRAGNYTTSVGAGGPYYNNGTPSYISGPGSFATIESAGGGKGGGNGPSAFDIDYLTTSGGSGGGGSSQNDSTYRTGKSGNSPPVSPPQGNPGGNGSTPTAAGGGGGGASSDGNPGSPGTFQSDGGNGRSAFDDTTTIPTGYGTPGPGAGRYFAGGGGGGSYPSANNLGDGGYGGGGSGGKPGYAATNGTGGTGGGGGGVPSSTVGKNGGSGIIIVRVLEL